MRGMYESAFPKVQPQTVEVRDPRPLSDDPKYNCPRCGGRHESMTGQKFDRPPGEWTDWATCPVTGDPVLFRSEPLADGKRLMVFG